MKILKWSVLALALSVAGPAMAQQGAPDMSDEAVFTRWDSNGDKQLTLAEFKAGMGERRKALALMRLQQQFKAVDKDGSGALEAGEFYELPIVKQGGKTAPVFGETDANRDGKIDFQEYVAMLARAAKAVKHDAGKP